MTQRSRYQDRIIRNYYENFDQIAVQRLSELVTDLFLAESGKARTRLWTKAAALLEKLKIPAARIQHLEKADNPTLLANLVQELLSGKAPSGSAVAPAPGSASSSPPARSSASAPSGPPASPPPTVRSTASKRAPAARKGRSAKQ